MSQTPMYFSPENGSFYDPVVHGVFLPTDCIAVTRKRHRELLDEQGKGAQITVGKAGKPVAKYPDDATLAELRKQKAIQINGEARLRILAIADIPMQSNDNAAIAMFNGISGLSDDERETLSGALARRVAINAVLRSAKVLKNSLRRMNKSILQEMQIDDPAFWPERFGDN